MPISVKHTYVSSIPDSGDTTLVQPSNWNADHTLVGLGTMAEQDANNVNIAGGSGTFTIVTTPTVQTNSSAGLALKNSAGTTQISMGAGGGDNVTIPVPVLMTNINITGTTSFDGAQGIAGQVLTSAGTGNTPVWGAAPVAAAGGSNTQIQFNNSGVLAGNSTYTMVSGVMKENNFNFVSQADVGSAPNQIPLNQYLGTMGYQDSAGVNITGGFASNIQYRNTFFIAQPTPSAINASATLTIAQLLTGIITTNSATAVGFTLPTGTLTDAGVLNGLLLVNQSFQWNIINTGSASGAVTVSGGTGHTLVGSGVLAITTSATFRTVKTATNTFVTYRIA
jgi:hypothetical protein